MVRVHIWLRRKDGLSSEEFREYWLSTHAPIARDGYANLRGYVVHDVTRVPGGRHLRALRRRVDDCQSGVAGRGSSS